MNDSGDMQNKYSETGYIEPYNVLTNASDLKEINIYFNKKNYKLSNLNKINPFNNNFNKLNNKNSLIATQKSLYETNYNNTINTFNNHNSFNRKFNIKAKIYTANNTSLIDPEKSQRNRKLLKRRNDSSSTQSPKFEQYTIDKTFNNESKYLSIKKCNKRTYSFSNKYDNFNQAKEDYLKNVNNTATFNYSPKETKGGSKPRYSPNSVFNEINRTRTYSPTEGAKKGKNTTL